MLDINQVFFFVLIGTETNLRSIKPHRVNDLVMSAGGFSHKMAIKDSIYLKKSYETIKEKIEQH